jgi:hypothetical protein
MFSTQVIEHEVFSPEKKILRKTKTLKAWIHRCLRRTISGRSLMHRFKIQTRIQQMRMLPIKSSGIILEQHGQSL